MHLAQRVREDGHAKEENERAEDSLFVRNWIQVTKADGRETGEREVEELNYELEIV